MIAFAEREGQKVGLERLPGITQPEYVPDDRLIP